MTDRVNRVLWTLLGLVLAVGGTLGALASQGHVGFTDPQSPVLWDWAIRTWRDHGDAAALVTAGAGALIAVLGYLLLRAQLPHRRRTLPVLRVERDGERGITEVRGGAFPNALRNDLARLPAVRGAHVVLSGPAEATRVRARLDVAPGATATALSREVQQCLDRFTTTTGVRVGRLDVTLRPDQAPADRVQ